MSPIVVKFTDNYAPKKTKVSRMQQKVLRSGKPVSVAQLEVKKARRMAQQSAKKHGKAAPDEDDSQNLKNDLELQRMLEESHILEESGGTRVGKARVRVLDSRIGKLAAENGTRRRKLENMPMAMRKGMVRAQAERTRKYQEEAREAGIVLSRTRRGEFRREGDTGVTSFTDRIGTGVRQKAVKRQKGLKVNSVGKSIEGGYIVE